MLRRVEEEVERRRMETKEKRGEGEEKIESGRRTRMRKEWNRDTKDESGGGRGMNAGW